MTRGDELRVSLDQVRQRIASASSAAGRAPDSVTLIVITKNFPASDVHLLADLGVTDVGENRHPEAQDKRADCLELDLRWHFVGGLQSNKAAIVGSYSDVVHSVDRPKLIAGLSRGFRESDREGALDCLIQVSLDHPESTGERSGVRPADLAALAEAVSNSGELNLRGLMAVAPLGEPPEPAFERLAGIRDEFLKLRPDADWLSAGMSGDLEQAIAAGATHVRVGRSVLGQRPSVK